MQPAPASKASELDSDHPGPIRWQLPGITNGTEDIMPPVLTWASPDDVFCPPVKALSHVLNFAPLSVEKSPTIPACTAHLEVLASFTSTVGALNVPPTNTE